MTLSPEARAKALGKAVRECAIAQQPIGWMESAFDEVETLIATAIREACNGKLEEAALVAERRKHLSSELSYMMACREVASSIRSLKDPTP